MRKICLFVLMLLIMPLSVSASNKIYDIDINVNILEDGTANITEVWDVDGSDGTEWYKVMNNLGNSELSNFSVSMDGNDLKYKSWNVNESLSQKKGYYGINYTSDGLELCFGKSDMNRHTFTLNYTLSNFIFNTDDSQVLYFNFIDELSDVDFDNFSVTISSYYDFTLDIKVYSYGYDGLVGIEDGKIKMFNDGDMDDDYVVLLAKFPLGTFNTTNRYDSYDTFDDVYKKAQMRIVDDMIAFVIVIIIMIMIPIIGVIINYNIGYGYKGNKKIDKKNLPMFRDIPCDKDIYYANTLIKLNNFGYKESNILGAIILKWIRNKKIVFKNNNNNIIGSAKKNSVIDLTMDSTFDNELETKLFNIMRAASNDGILETKEFEKWCKVHYSEVIELFNRIVNESIGNLKKKNFIYNRNDKKECKYKNVMNDKIYNDSVELYGLKKYLEEFSRINTKEVIEVHLWDEYLMFAYLFGIADKVAKQLKDLYPEYLQQENFDYDTIVFVNHISTRGISAATSAMSAASSGGGGGSFGGGGGGSR